MSAFRFNDHVRFRVMTAEGMLSGNGQIIGARSGLKRS